LQLPRHCTYRQLLLKGRSPPKVNGVDLQRTLTLRRLKHLHPLIVLSVQLAGSKPEHAYVGI
jgi:hypothetical protein